MTPHDESIYLETIAQLIERLRRAESRQSYGFVYRGRSSTRPPKKQLPPLDGSEDRL